MDALRAVGITNTKKYSALVKNCDETSKKRILYQIVGDILSGNANEEKYGWEHSCYDNIRKQMDEYEAYLIKPFDVVEGVVECSKCKSRKTWSIQKQHRSADEPMTTYSTCVDCGHEFRYSG